MDEAWSARDVYLLTEGADGPIAVPHLTLTFLASGVALGTPDTDDAAATVASIKNIATAHGC
jgi:hypothetical protein